MPRMGCLSRAPRREGLPESKRAHLLRGAQNKRRDCNFEKDIILRDNYERVCYNCHTKMMFPGEGKLLHQVLPRVLPFQANTIFGYRS
jgi:hypothetical protein